VNTTTSGLRIRKSGANNIWILVDDDPANSYSHDRIAWSSVDTNREYPFNVVDWNAGTTITNGEITNSSAPTFSTILSAGTIAWSGGPNEIYPWNVASWTGGPSILNGLVTDSNSPSFDSFVSHSKIAWSGGENENYPWDVTAWTGGETILNGTITNSTSPLNLFTTLLSGPHPGSNPPVFSNFLLETFDAQTGFKILGNSELNGEALTSGHIINYIGLTTGLDLSSSNYISPDQFQSQLGSEVRTKFILDVNASQVNRPQPALEDISTDNTSTVSLIGDIERSQSIINRSLTSNFNFLQIGVTGEL
jgi:hypothetical protein